MNKYLIPSVVAAAGLAAAPCVADDTGAGVIDDLRDQVESLKQEVATLKQGSDENWLTEQRAEEIRGLVHDVLADADTRASLLQSGMTAGYNKGFYLASEDGNFTMTFNGQIQTRFVYNQQRDAPGPPVGDGDDDRWGFEVRRAKLKFKGHVVDPTWKYKLNGAYNRSGGDFQLEDAEITKDFENGWQVRFGQFKPPYLREELVSSSRQLAVERSLVNEAYNQDRSIGVEVGYKTTNFRVAGMFSNGFGEKNQSALAYDTEYAFTGRAEFLFAGEWSQFKDLTSWSGDEFGFMVGVAGHFENDEFGTDGPPGGETQTWAVTVDASLEFGGSNVFAYFVYQHADAASDADQWAFVVQGGYHFVPDEWEVYARYEYGDDDLSPDKNINLITVGVNRYFDKHGLKWTTDFGYAFDAVSDFYSSSGAGWRADSEPGGAEGKDGQWVIRTQMQLLW